MNKDNNIQKIIKFIDGCFLTICLILASLSIIVNSFYYFYTHNIISMILTLINILFVLILLTFYSKGS
jgi:uncharacterized Tic20 family protein